MFDKYLPVELPKEINDDSRKSRLLADDRVPADRPVLGVAGDKETEGVAARRRRQGGPD